MKGGSGDKFFTTDHLLMVSDAYIPNFRALALLLLLEKLGTEMIDRKKNPGNNGHLVFN